MPSSHARYSNGVWGASGSVRFGGQRVEVVCRGGRQLWCLVDALSALDDTQDCARADFPGAGREKGAGPGVYTTAGFVAVGLAERSDRELTG